MALQNSFKLYQAQEYERARNLDDLKMLLKSEKFRLQQLELKAEVQKKKKYAYKTKVKAILINLLKHPVKLL